MEGAIKTLVDNFYKYADTDDCRKTLSLAEFKDLLAQELPSYTKDADRKMSQLDTNQDDKLTFQEFWAFIGELAQLKNQSR